MIYELRQYDIKDDAWDAYVEWAEQIMMPVLFEKFGFPLVGFFETLPVEEMEHDPVNRTVGVHWILRWESMDERQRRWAEFRADPDYKAAVEASRDSQGNPRFHMNEQITFMTAWPVSPLQ